MRLAFSGGGFRATLFHLGVIRYLKDKSRLSEVETIHSVSGGSILAAHLVLNWHKYTAADNKLFAEAAAEIVSFCGHDIRGQLVRRWLLFWAIALFIFVVPASVVAFFWGHSLTGLLSAGILVVMAVFIIRWTHARFALVRLLQDSYDGLYRRARLADLRSASTPALHLLATNLTTGDMASFTANGLTLHAHGGDVSFAQNGLPVALAVAASSAFPPLFPPVEISRATLKADVKDFTHSQYLTDGGVYDNLGLRAARRVNTDPPSELVVSSAERRFDWQVAEKFGFLPARASRATEILMQRVSDLETDDRLWGKDARTINLSTDVSNGTFMLPQIQRLVRNIRTDLDRFHPVEIQLLVYRGYCAARHQFENADDCPEGIYLPDDKLPVATLPAAWLPAKEAELAGVDTEKQLEASSKSAWRLWHVADWTSWALLVVLALTLLLSYPALVMMESWYRSQPVRPGSQLQWSVVNASSGAAMELLRSHRNLRSYLIETAAASIPEYCEESANMMIFSDRFSQTLGDRRVAAFNVRIALRLRSLEFLPVKAFLTPETQDYIRGPLPTRIDEDGSLIVACPQTESSDRLVVLFVLCSKDQSAGLREEIDLGQFFEIRIETRDEE